MRACLPPVPRGALQTHLGEEPPPLPVAQLLGGRRRSSSAGPSHGRQLPRRLAKALWGLGHWVSALQAGGPANLLPTVLTPLLGGFWGIDPCPSTSK